MDAFGCAPEIPNQVKCLGQDHAIQAAVSDDRRIGQIADQGRLRIAGVHVQDFLPRYAVTPKKARILVVADFKYRAANIGSVPLQEALNVIAIDRQPAVPPKSVTDRRDGDKISEADSPRRRRPRPAQCALDAALEPMCAGSHGPGRRSH